MPVYQGTKSPTSTFTVLTLCNAKPQDEDEEEEEEGVGEEEKQQDPSNPAPYPSPLFGQQELVREQDVVAQDETVQHLWHAHEDMSKAWSTSEACVSEQVRVVNVVGGN
ncbi:unnamed protein product [Ectocarpus sp. CCAP 1310/34]|nr:unnamed protein product [Ectocarpus sp. CCAP 1310/34]